MILACLLFVVYFVVKVRQFSKDKEWKDLFVFVVLSVIASYFVLVFMFNWGVGYPIRYLHSITGPIAHRVFPAIFGIEM
ncbi:DUF3810 domain-containing protein [Aneurinibacillus sp. XH2]|uniref:DUF3810 domain-containing protein n=1 Tax=Aneurinibacillus sp. XH2 TaxID=1450761 RepID=UPI00138EFAD4|nr:DUF3810 domain-containing protein [Aneurinibacillus sp. XH2]